MVVRSDCDLLIRRETWLEVDASLTALVFCSMTWKNGGLGPMVVARCIDIFLSMVSVMLVS